MQLTDEWFSVEILQKQLSYFGIFKDLLSDLDVKAWILNSNGQIMHSSQEIPASCYHLGNILKLPD